MIPSCNYIFLFHVLNQASNKQASKDLIVDLSLKMYLKITWNTIWLNYELIISKHLLKTLLIHHTSKLCGEIKSLWTAVCLKS